LFGVKNKEGSFMKRGIGKIVVAIIAAAAMAGCESMPFGTSGGSSSDGRASSSSKERNVRGRGIPQFVKDAVKNVPENALVGIGTAKLASISQSRTTAATRGRTEISRQLDTLIKDMVRDYQASSEVDPKAAIAFQENITVALSQARLQGASVVEEDMDDAGNYWTVVMLSKAEVAKEINQATASAKLKVPAAASFDAEKRMNAAFDAVKNDVQVVSN
jgi:hypothetical protein